MPNYERIEVNDVDGVTLVRFVERKVVDAEAISLLGDELFGLVEGKRGVKLLLNLEQVEFLSSAALNKLIVLDQKIKAAEGTLKLCGLRPEITEVFVITRLNQLFDIRDETTAAIASF